VQFIIDTDLGVPFNNTNVIITTCVWMCHVHTCTTGIHSRLKLRVPIKSLPRESRAVFVLHGVELLGSGTKQNKTIISWVSLNLFTSNGFVNRKLILVANIILLHVLYLYSTLQSGSKLLGMWSGDDVDPLVSPSSDIKDRERLLQVQYFLVFRRISLSAYSLLSAYYLNLLA
jgi:hypothetical protein